MPIEIEIDARRHEMTVPLTREPSMFVVDPHLHVLMDLTVEQPTPRFIEQLRDGPTLPSRLRAAEALASRPESAVTAALRATVADSTAHHALRAEAAAALGRQGHEGVLVSLLQSGLGDARVIRAAIEALRETGGEDALEQFRRLALDSSASYETRAQALRGLGQHGEPADATTLLQCLEVSSADDEIRQQSLRALADLDEPEGLDAALRFAAPGTLNRTRAVAIGAAGDLAPHDLERAVDALLALLDDREHRVRNAAGGALARIGDESALDKLDRLAEAHRDHAFRARCARWAEQIRAGESEPTREALEKRLRRLERQVDELRRTGEDN